MTRYCSYNDAAISTNLLGIKLFAEPSLKQAKSRNSFSNNEPYFSAIEVVLTMISPSLGPEPIRQKDDTKERSSSLEATTYYHNWRNGVSASTM